MDISKDKALIYICSDEKINIHVFNDYHFYYNQRSFINDFCILKNADFIISTRSIYSFCASIFGDNFIYVLNDINYKFTKDDIKKYNKIMLEEYDLKINKRNII
jgi:hypothetical protein